MEKTENVTLEQVGGKLRWRVEARSIIGGRSEQQDAAYCYVGDREIFAVVCDGVGGGADGAVAAQKAVAVMRDAYLDHGAGPERDRPGLLKNALTAADAAVREALAGQSGGTTVVAALVCEDCMHWVSAGDSRLYITRRGEVCVATRDHNYALRLDEKLARGEIGQAEHDGVDGKRRDALISFLGAKRMDVYDLTQMGFRVRRGDCILLTTDGLYKGLSQVNLQEVLGAQMDTKAKADMLLSVLSGKVPRKGQDNTTFILIDIL